MPSSVIMAEVAGGTLNSSAANFRTAVKGVFSGTESTLKGSLGSEVRVILNVTLEAEGAAMVRKTAVSGALSKDPESPLGINQHFQMVDDSRANLRCYSQSELLAQ